MVAWWILIIVALVAHVVTVLICAARWGRSQVDVVKLLGVKMHPDWSPGKRTHVAVKMVARLRQHDAVQEAIRQERGEVLRELGYLK